MDHHQEKRAGTTKAGRKRMRGEGEQAGRE
jgi:hypothetical protein